MIFQIIVLFSILRYKTAHKQLENIYTVVYVWSDHNFHVFERLTGNGLILQHFHIESAIETASLGNIRCFSAHRHASVLDALQRANIKVVYVPAGCTDELQLLDLKVNKVFKDILKKQFQDWYADQVTKFLKKNKKLDKFEIDLRLSVIKPIHARWLVKTLTQLLDRTDLIKSAFEAAGIVVNQ